MSRWLVVVLSLLLLSPAWADEPKQKKKKKKAKEPPVVLAAPVDRSKEATTDLAKVDSDFTLQGEYMGCPQRAWQGAELIGLQVVALGDGKFEGVLLRGGLPGAGWDRATKVKLTGERRNSAAILLNDELKIEVSGQAAIVRQRRGEMLGQLRKLQRISPTQDAPPPAGAIVLFDGTNTAQFQNGKMTADRLLEAGAITKMPVSDFQLHLEFRTPYMPYARGQGRGNSGVYIQQRYEVQVLDSFGLEGADNECGGLYKQQRPAVNMCLPPLSWQTYDIYFTAARWTASGQMLAPARITVIHNGEPVHLNYELTAKTGGGKAEGAEPFPILLQNHNNPVAYRNIWIVPTGPIDRGGGSYASDTACEDLQPNRASLFGRSLPSTRNETW